MAAVKSEKKKKIIVIRWYSKAGIARFSFNENASLF